MSNVLYALALLLSGAGLNYGLRHRIEAMWALFAVSDACLTICSALDGNWTSAALCGACGIGAAWNWRHWHRKRRDRAKGSPGARALVADLVRRMRQAARPSRVLRPALGGAR